MVEPTEHHRVEVGAQLLDGHVDADVDAGTEHRALSASIWARRDDGR